MGDTTTDEQRKEAFTYEELRRLVEYTNTRDGTAPRAYQSQEEMEVARDFALQLKKRTGIMITDLQCNNDDPPDCIAYHDGELVGIEITELADRQVRHARIRLVQQWMSTRDDKADDQQCIDHVHALYDLTFETSLRHDRERFLRNLRNSLRGKDEKLGTCVQHMLVHLVVFTRDPWLDEETVSSFLQGETFRMNNIDKAWFLGDYYGGEYPIQELPIDQN